MSLLITFIGVLVGLFLEVLIDWPGFSTTFAIATIGGQVIWYLRKILNKLNKNDSHTKDET